MTFQTIRLIFKELRVLRLKEPNIARRLTQSIKIHVEAYQRTRPLLKSKINLQKDDQLPKACLRCLREANTPNSFNGFRAKVKLIQIFLGVSPFVDESCNFKKGKLSIQMAYLEKYDQFKKLPTEKDRQFVRGVIKKLLKGEQKYQYNNLTAFFDDVRYESNLISMLKPLADSESNLKLLSPSMQNYVNKTILGETEGVNQQYRQIYKYMFTTDSRKDFDKLMDSYLNSRYIALDLQTFEGIN